MAVETEIQQAMAQSDSLWRDFEALCREKSIRILNRQVVSQHWPDRQLTEIWPNLFGETAIYHLSK